MLSFRRFQLAFHRVNVHRPTSPFMGSFSSRCSSVASRLDAGTRMALRHRLGRIASLRCVPSLGMSSCARRLAFVQGLPLVHFSAQCKRFLWDRECIQGLLRGCLSNVRGLLEGIQGVFCVRNGSG